MQRIINLIKNINYLTKHSLWKQREEDIVYLTSKIIDDAAIRYEQKTLQVPHILSKEDSLELVLNSGKSFVRTGDGELKLIMGLDQPFQKYEKEIADRLSDVLANNRDNLLIGINATYYTYDFSFDDSFFLRRYAYDYRQIYSKYIDFNSTYLHAALHGYSLKEINEQDAERYERWRNAFAKKNVVIVCGEGILDRLEYDIFELAKTKRFVYGPRINAWNKKNEIMSEIKNTVDKDCLVIFILGMAGKAMIPELADMGYVCWDVGHLAKYYDAFKRNKELSSSEISDFFAPD